MKRKVIVNGGKERCHDCGDWFKGITNHWAKSSCQYPKVSNNKIELLKGCLLGDGSVYRGNANPYIDVAMTNKTFLEWLDEKLGWLSNGVVRKHTSVKSAKNARQNLGRDTQPSETLDFYRLQTRSIPQFNRFSSWYNTGEKVFPDGLVLSPVATRMWFVTDGCLAYDSRPRNRTPRISFASTNEKERPETIIQALEEHGFTVSHSGHDFRLSAKETEDFFDWIGKNHVPGFEYKWEYHDYTKYQQLKLQCRENHCTQTLSN